MRKPIKPEHVFPFAKRWWESKRPVGWTVEQHLANPKINTVNEVEAKLADVVAGVMLPKRSS